MHFRKRSSVARKCRFYCPWNVPWLVLYQIYHLFPNLWIWLAAMATKRLNLRKRLKNHLLRSHKGDKAKTSQKCSWHKPLQNWCVFLLLMLMYFHCYGNFKFPLTYNGKSKKLEFIAISLQIFWQKLFGWSSTKHILFCPIWLVVMATERLNVWKTYSKINSSEAKWGTKLKLCRNVHSMSLYKTIVLLLLLLYIMGTWKLALIAVSLQVFGQDVFRNVCRVVLYQA